MWQRRFTEAGDAGLGNRSNPAGADAEGNTRRPSRTDLGLFPGDIQPVPGWCTNRAAWPAWDRGSSVEVMNPARRRRGAGIDTSLVECIVVGVPDLTSVAEVATALADLAEAAAIRILDV